MLSIPPTFILYPSSFILRTMCASLKTSKSSTLFMLFSSRSTSTITLHDHGFYHVLWNSRNVEMTLDYLFSPSRRRSCLEEIAPFFFVRDRERSMIARNLRFVLSDTVSSSAFRIGTTAAKGFPFFTTITGSFLAFWAYFDNGSDAFFNSILVIGQLFLRSIMSTSSGGWAGFGVSGEDVISDALHSFPQRFTRESAHQLAGEFEKERIAPACGDERQPERATIEFRQRQ